MTRKHHRNRDRRVGRLLSIVALALSGVLSASAQDLSTAELKSTQLSETVYLLELEPPVAGNLAVLVGDDGIILVDDQMMPVAPKIKAAIEKLQTGKIDFVINTHYHFDHAGGNAAFGLESAIVAHESVRMRLLEGREAGTRFSATPTPEEALPVITFQESVTLHFNGETIDVIHFPSHAHADGGSVVFFRDSNVLHTGDQFVNIGGFPYIDRDVGGSALGLRDNIARILAIIDDETKIIPGHGPLATKADVQGFHDLVASSIEHIEGAKSSGQTLEEIQSAGLPTEFEEYGKGGFIPEGTWIEFVYSSLDD